MENSFLPDSPLSAESLTDHIGELFQSMEAVPIGVAVTDLTGRLLFVNQRILKALGYSRDMLVGQDVGIMSRVTLDADLVQRILTRSVEGGWKGELTGYRQDGSGVPVFIETNAMRNRAGEPIAVVWVARDITEQRAFQKRLVAEGKLGTLGLIAHNMAHEIRNHLSAIKLSLYMLEKARVPDPDETLHFSIAREELNRIELFLRTLVNYAKPPKPRFDWVDLVDAVNQGLEDARPILNLKSVALFRQFPAGPPRVRIDRGQFAQAVSQVVQNASEAMDHKGEIHVVLKRQPLETGAQWLVEIRDNGPGIAPHLQARVFEPFFTTTGHQLGLGLSNVRRIMDLHQGSVSLDSTPGRGTVVVLKLPETGAGS